MSTNNEILFVPDLAAILKTTEGAIRAHHNRGNYHAIPKPRRIGSRRLAWLRKDVNSWLENTLGHNNGRK